MAAEAPKRLLAVPGGGNFSEAAAAQSTRVAEIGTSLPAPKRKVS
jgi:hypothetical protein